jgi:hypothetical protein
MQQDLYRSQVALLVRLLPAIAEEACFALKGGTAINLFVWNDLPRLSVDIDLVYTPFNERDTALKNISRALANISDRVKKDIPGLATRFLERDYAPETKLECSLGKDAVKRPRTKDNLY